MNAKLNGFMLCALLVAAIGAGGCVQRKITITTEPQGALVVLNDEEIGSSPVTVGFEWYGDYSVKITKEGYQTLKTHQNLPRPLKDFVLLDLFADIFTNKIDHYQWHFALAPLEPVDEQKLIESAQDFKRQALAPEPTKKKKTKTQ